jgi:hypothetical protein
MDIQNLLDRLMAKELLKLKRQFFKFRHINFLRHKITIASKNLIEDVPTGASGLYVKIEGKHQFDFSHSIFIDEVIVNEYVNYKRNYFDYTYGGISKRYYKNRLKQVIKHELIHAFVEEYYGGWIDINGVSNDASPIFLAVLYWCGGRSNHNCIRAFRKSELFNKIKDFTEFKDFDVFITRLLMDYEKIYNKWKDGIKINDSLVKNRFYFSPRDAGLKKCMQLKTEWVSKAKINIKNMEYNSFEIGCCIMPDAIEKLLEKKRYGKFEKFEYEKYKLGIDEQTTKSIKKIAVGM